MTEKSLEITDKVEFIQDDEKWTVTFHHMGDYILAYGINDKELEANGYGFSCNQALDDLKEILKFRISE